MPAPSKTMLLAAVFGIGSLAFAGGFAASSATAAPRPAAPIVNVDAWNEAPASASRVRIAAEMPAAACNPWEVSDVAMEEILREMQRRGWRQPRQGEAIASLESLGVEGIGVVDASAPMPTRSSGGSMVTVLTDDQAEQLRTQQITLDELIADEQGAASPS